MKHSPVSLSFRYQSRCFFSTETPSGDETRGSRITEGDENNNNWRNMLPSLLLRPNLINNALCRVITSELMIVRQKGGKGSPSQSQGRRRPRDHRDYRVKFAPGSWVREKVILATQGKLDYHPGLNVSNIVTCFFIVLIQCICICRLQSILGTSPSTPSEVEL